MRFLGISSYPFRWRRFLQVASLLDIVIALEGIATLVWLLASPSEPGSRVFLAYSFARWGLIVVTVILISLFAFVLWVINYKHGWTLKILEPFDNEKPAANLLVFATIIFVTMLGIQLGFPCNERIQVYYWQLFPILFFITLIVFQVWIFLLVSLPQTRSRLLNTWFPLYREDQSHFKTINKKLLIGLILISLLYVFAQVRAGIRVPEAVPLGDTTSYLEGAGMQLSDPAFFSERRPWGILLIYKMLGGSLSAIGLAQLTFSTIAWQSLAWILVGSLKSKGGKLLGFVFVLGISLSPTVQAWNHAGLSESFSISTTVTILALLIGLLQRWKWSIFLSLIFFFALWVSIHEVNFYMGLLAAITLFIFGLVRKHFRTFLVLSFSIAVMLVINFHLSSLYALPRWALPVAEVITKRILPEPQYLDYFSRHGMPVRPELLALSGRWAHSDNYAILNDLKFRKFSNWLFRDGKTVYVKFLIAHPIYTLTMPLINLDEMLAVDFSHLIPGYQPALPLIANEFLFPFHWFWIYIGLSVLLLGFTLWQHRREKSRAYWLIVIFFAFSIPYLYLAWHGDALDVKRHASIANVQFHLGMWLLVVFLIDTLLKNRSVERK